MLYLFKKKSLSPLVTTILLVVVSVVIIGVIISWSKGISLDVLSSSNKDNFYSDKDFSGLLKFDKIINDNLFVKNLSSNSLEISSYKINSSLSSPYLNTEIPLTSPLTISPQLTFSLPLFCIPETAFSVELKSTDSRYISFPVKTFSSLLSSCNLSYSFLSPLNSTYYYDQNIDFNISSLKSIGNVNCSWSSSLDGVLSNSCNFSTFLSIGSHTITFTVSDLYSSQEDSFSLEVNDRITPIINSPAATTFLVGSLINLNGSAINNNSVYTCSWSSSIDGFLGNGCDINISLLTLGNHTISLTVQDISANNTSDVNVFIKSPFTFEITSPITSSEYIYQSSINFLSNYSNTFGTVECSWSSSIDGNFGNDCDLNYSSLSIGSHTITLEISDTLEFKEDYVITNIINPLFLYSTGLNTYRQLGYNNSTNRTTFGKPVSFNDWKMISAGEYHSLGIRNGELYSWGFNNHGATGLGLDTGNTTGPTKVGSFNDWNFVYAGKYHSFGIRNGELFVWGYNNGGQLGLGDTTNRTTPTKVGSFNDWNFVSAGGGHSLGIRNGELYAWGSNSYGQLGLGDFGAGTNRLEPTQIGSFNDWNFVSAGDYHSLAIRNGELYVWGRNNSYQLGLGNFDSAQRNSPVQLGSFNDWTMVSAGDRSAGIRNNILYFWGTYNNDYCPEGGLTNYIRGNPTIFGNNPPGWKTVSVNGKSYLAINNDGELYAYGRNIDGLLGLGNNCNFVGNFTKVGTFNDWESVSMGGSHSLALRKS